MQPQNLRLSLLQALVQDVKLPGRSRALEESSCRTVPQIKQERQPAQHAERVLSKSSTAAPEIAPDFDVSITKADTAQLPATYYCTQGFSPSFCLTHSFQQNIVFHAIILSLCMA